MKTLARIFLCLACSGGTGGWAADRADLEGTSIIGSRELPKVTYIVPWKKSEAGELVGKPVPARPGWRATSRTATGCTSTASP